MTIKAPVSMCIIVKNEPFLEKSILSYRDKIEELVIVDTGSTDGTQEVAKKYADVFEVFTVCNNPVTGAIEDFSMARNRSFDLATKKWICWSDGDDLITGAENFSKIIEEYENSNSDLDGISYLFPYQYAYNELGQCILNHYRERLFLNRKCWIWKNPIHECCIIDNNARVNLITREDVVWKHQRQYIPGKFVEPNRNLRILKAYQEKLEKNGEEDARQLYYLGLEYRNAGFVDEAIKCHTRYVEVSGWPDEVAMSCLAMVDIYQSKGDFQESKKWAFKTIETKEDWGEGYLALGKCFYFLALLGGANESANWQKCIHFINMGLSFPPTKTLLFINPLERECEIHKYLNLAYNKLGRVQEALDSVNIGIIKQPNDPNFINNKKLYEDFLARNKIVENSNIIKNNGTIDQNAVNTIQAIINSQPTEPTKSPKEQVAISLNKLKDTGELSQFVVDIMIPLVNKQIDPDKFFAKVFKPDDQFSTNANGRPIANLSSHKENWNIPTAHDITTLPLSVSKEQLLASIIMIWKQYVVVGEMIAALSFLESAPSEVRYSVSVEKAINLTKIYIEKAGKNINNNRVIIDTSLADTDAAKELISNMHLAATTVRGVIDHFKKSGHKIKNCFIQEDGKIFVEGYDK